MRLLDYTNKALVEPNLASKDKIDAVNMLVDILERENMVIDREEVIRDLLDRENMMTTGIGGGIAIPHAYSGGVNDAVIAVGCVKDGIDFQSLDAKPVYVIFLVVTRKETIGLQVKMLARIARLVKHQSFIESLRNATTPDSIIAAIADEESRHV